MRTEPEFMKSLGEYNIPFKSIHFTEKGKAIDSGARIFDQFGGLNSLDQDTLYTGMN
jgi:hypothetical protein